MANWKLETKTIQEFQTFASSVDVNPIGQRPSVETSNIGKATPSKAQGIIGAILQGKDIGEIKIARNPIGKAYPFESIDGGHRKRAILDFLRNDFPTHESLGKFGGKYFYELSDELQQEFLNYTLRLVVYTTMNNVEKGENFRQSNYSTPVNHQEMLNSYGDAPIPNLIRNTVRVVPGLNNQVHPLFEYTISAKTGEATYSHLGFANNRLDHDERVARIAYLIYNGSKLDVCDKAELEKLYADNSIDDVAAKTIAKKLNDVLNFMYEIATARKRLKKGVGIGSKEFTMLYRLYFFFKEKYGNFKLVDPNIFYQKFDLAMLKFVGKDDSTLINDIVKDDHGSRTMSEAFKGYVTVHSSKKKMVNACVWLTEKAGFDPVADGSIQVRDNKRVYTKTEIEQKLAEQSYKCWVTGAPLTMKDAQGAHIVPYSKGGETVYSNLVVVSAEHNRKMGDMNAYDYKDLFEQNVIDA